MSEIKDSLGLENVGIIKRNVDVDTLINDAVEKEGDRVEKDQQIMILEAMKMEIDITAPVSGVISKILVNTTDSVEEGETLAIIG